MGSPKRSPARSPAQPGRPRLHSGEERLQRKRDSKSRVLNAQGRTGLEQYAYRGGAATPLDCLFNRLWWSPLAECLPRWVAPNSITVIGTVVVVLCHLLVLMLSGRDCRMQGVPSAAFLLAAASLFFYQTMDALDGKQARRTGSSSPLGQLCDHGCDALATVFITLGIGPAIDSGYMLCALVMLQMLVCFYATQVEEHFTGALRTGAGPLGVTEAQIGTICGFLLSFAYGPAWVALAVPLPELQALAALYSPWHGSRPVTFGDCYAGFFFATNNIVLWSAVCSTFAQARRKKQVRLACCYFLPLLAQLVAALLFSRPSPDFRVSGRLCLVTSGVTIAYLCCRVIVAGMLKVRVAWVSLLLEQGLPALGVALLLQPETSWARDNRGSIAGMHAMYVVTSIIGFSREVSDELCAYLDINFFTLKNKPAKKAK